jgi:hypothetical protein
MGEEATTIDEPARACFDPFLDGNALDATQVVLCGYELSPTWLARERPG